MAERVACTGFWAAFRTATSGFEAGLVAALAAGRLGRLIVDSFMGKIMRAGAAGSKRDGGFVGALRDEARVRAVQSLYCVCEVLWGRSAKNQDLLSFTAVEAKRRTKPRS